MLQIKWQRLLTYYSRYSLLISILLSCESGFTSYIYSKSRVLICSLIIYLSLYFKSQYSWFDLKRIVSVNSFVIEINSEQPYPRFFSDFMQNSVLNIALTLEIVIRSVYMYTSLYKEMRFTNIPAQTHIYAGGCPAARVLLESEQTSVRCRLKLRQRRKSHPYIIRPMFSYL